MTDVGVQYFTNSNGITLPNTWGALIDLLDICLVNGINLPFMSDITIDSSGNLNITTDANHNCSLFQIVELKNFNPSSLNGKYRIIGVPASNKIILKSPGAIAPIAIGQGKLASLGYEIIFTQTNKRVYRAINPRTEHPYIRVDETLTSADGTTGVYPANYGKSAIVGLLESMTHIDDYENPDVLQLPMRNSIPGFNWKITGTNGDVIKGWSRWYYSVTDTYSANETYGSKDGNKPFTIVGDSDAFYFRRDYSLNGYPVVSGCGLYENAIDKPYPWFLASHFRESIANNNSYGGSYHFPLILNTATSFFMTTNILELKGDSVSANVFQQDGQPTGTGYMGLANNVPAFDLPFKGHDSYVRGTLKHIKFAGKKVNEGSSYTTILDGTSMYLWAPVFYWATWAGHYYYLGEVE